MSRKRLAGTVRGSSGEVADADLARFGITTTPVSRPGRLRRLASGLWWVVQFLRGELRSEARLSLRHTLRAWSLGFSRWTYALFELDRNDPRLYVTDRNQVRALARVNGVHRPPVGHKLIFSRYVESLGVPCPAIWAVVVKGRIHVLNESAPAAGWPWLRAYVAENANGVVLKPIVGAEGLGIAFLRKSGPVYELNGRAATEAEVMAVVARLDDYLVTDFVVQHEYSVRLYPRTTNTIRLLTLWSDETESPFLAAAVHRIGTARSYPVDNFRIGAGGMSARIDLATGRLGRAACRSEAGVVERYERHPETGDRIEGVCIPGWVETTRKVLAFAARLPFLPFIGWDLVVTPDGYKVVEINAGSGFYVVQVHHPLLEDPRVRRFFEAHGLV
ncbi:MAG TPA: sugar-transfer associated ATP-grasp domain-containing protein [Thermoanaerobaculaceae bacterium]|nr:sugar-transfer associated ATP-grasp domain-containing protein [Thermoanaerobaculaceae bacterium]